MLETEVSYAAAHAMQGGRNKAQTRHDWLVTL